MTMRDDRPNGKKMQDSADEGNDGPPKPDRNEIRGIQRKLRRTVPKTGLSEEEIRLLSIFMAAQPDPMDCLSSSDPAASVQAMFDRQTKRAQYSNLFNYDDGVISGPIGINSERYLRVEKSLQELLVAKGAIEKVMDATRAAYEEHWKYHMELLKVVAEKLAESAAQNLDDVDLTKGDTKA